MRRYWWLLVALVVLTALLLKIGAALGQDTGRFYALNWAMVSGSWAYGFRPFGILTPQDQQITGYAFGPGRNEVAFCGPAGERWALWKAALTSITEARQQRQQRAGELDAQLESMGYRNAPRSSLEELHDLVTQTYDRAQTAPRPLWTAPEGVALQGPLWWSPDGTTILVRAIWDGAADLVAVDDMTGKATWLTRGKTVIEVAWSATGRRMAYVTEDRGTRIVWVRDAGMTREAGPGGYDLRWSPDSSSLRWLAPGAGVAWAEMEWQAATGRAQQVGTKPARPEGTTWSPDGRWCAGVTDGTLMLWPAASPHGEAVPLPDVGPRRAMSWSPDSNLLLVLGKEDALFLVMVSPPPPGAYVLDSLEGSDLPQVLDVAKARAARVGWFAAEDGAGDPSWSSDGRALAFAAVAKEGRREHESDPLPQGELFVFEFDRQYVEVALTLTPRVERAVVLQNTKYVAAAMQMYLTDYDVSPPVAEQQRVMWILDEYVRNRDVFMRPGKPGEMVVQWRFTPGQPASTIDDPTTEVAAIIDYSPEFYAVAYMDGHAKLIEKER